ncbi:MAG: HD domain-containing protein [Spirosomaceae bacterium]|jgi:uncharacterized protein|nr:HD domain-containing protein [Spirosomataceae bacterium]
MNLKAAEKYVYEKLQKNLSPTLTYHGFHHTLDVVQAALQIAQVEGIEDEESLVLLQTAAMYHDLGFISTYKGHEEEGCRIAKLTLPGFGFGEEQIEDICGMIMATKIPQQPHTLLEKIIADADLDYLGRDDFEPISQSLFLELREREMVSSIENWNRIQVGFLSGHHYWTKSALALRNDQKQQRLRELKAIVETY